MDDVVTGTESPSAEGFPVSMAQELRALYVVSRAARTLRGGSRLKQELDESTRASYAAQSCLSPASVPGRADMSVSESAQPSRSRRENKLCMSRRPSAIK